MITSLLDHTCFIQINNRSLSGLASDLSPLSSLFSACCRQSRSPPFSPPGQPSKSSRSRFSVAYHISRGCSSWRIYWVTELKTIQQHPLSHRFAAPPNPPPSDRSQQVLLLLSQDLFAANALPSPRPLTGTVTGGNRRRILPRCSST